MNEVNDLSLTVAPETALARPAPSVAEMLHAVIERGVTQENVGALDKLCDLYERMEARNAEKQFAAAFVALQAEMPKVKAVRSIPSHDGTVRSRFAPYEEIMTQVAPLLQKHGFTVTFSTDYKEGRIVKTCTLQHVAGHSRSNQFAVRIGSGPPKASEAQADGAASTYAKRFALCDALNIVIDVDVDAAAEGHPITPEQAESLRQRVQETATDEKRFLSYAGAATFEEITTSKFSMLDAALRRKEKTT